MICPVVLFFVNFATKESRCQHKQNRPEAHSKYGGTGPVDSSARLVEQSTEASGNKGTDLYTWKNVNLGKCTDEICPIGICNEFLDAKQEQVQQRDNMQTEQELGGGFYIALCKMCQPSPKKQGKQGEYVVGNIRNEVIKYDKK